MAEKKKEAKKEEAKKEETSLNKDQQKVMDLVEKMSVLELADLVHAMEDKFGVSAAAPVAAMPAAGGAADEEEEEKSAYDIVLQDIGDNKIGIIKIVRKVSDIGLKDAKELVEKGAGTVLKEAVDTEEAEEIKKEIEDAGGKVELK
jgi:large subunit ribosomal protein L7/L12